MLVKTGTTAGRFIQVNHLTLYEKEFIVYMDRNYFPVFCLYHLTRGETRPIFPCREEQRPRGNAMSKRNATVWKLWQRMPANAGAKLWERFNAVILRRFGPPESE